MKKTLVVIVVFLSCIINVKGINIALEKNGEIILEEFKQYKVGNYKAYLISPFTEYEITDAWQINNIVVCGDSNDNEYYQATIQMLIWQIVHPDYDVYIVRSNGSKYNVDNYISQIESYVNRFDRSNSINNNTYDIYYNKITYIKSNDAVFNYISDNEQVTLNGSNDIIIKPDWIGLKKITFTNKLFMEGNLVYGHSFTYKPFSIYVNGLANIVTFNILGKSNYSYTFDMYNINNSYINTFTIDNDNNTLFFERGKELIYLKERDNLLEDIIIYETDEFNYEVVLDYTNEYYNLNISTILEDTHESIYNSCSIYNEDYEYIMDCGDNVTLKYGSYIIKDNISNYEVSILLDSDSNIVLKRYREVLDSGEEVNDLEVNIILPDTGLEIGKLYYVKKRDYYTI